MRKPILIRRSASCFGLPVAFYNQHLAVLQYQLEHLEVPGEQAKKLFPKAEGFQCYSRIYIRKKLLDRLKAFR